MRDILKIAENRRYIEIYNIQIKKTKQHENYQQL